MAPHLRCLLTLAGSIIGEVATATDDMPSQPQIEVPTWSASYQGYVASKAVKARLWRLDNLISGDYCYEPCDARIGPFLQLEGMATATILIETPPPPSGKEAVPSGRWHLPPELGTAPLNVEATWQSMDGLRRRPIVLERLLADATHEPGFELRLMMDGAVNTIQDCLGQGHRMVSAIRIYKDGELAQTLDSDSEGSCRSVQPRWVDANFDGWPDLTQAQHLAGANVSHAIWLYAPRRQRFELAPQVLQDVPNPEFDSEFQRIFSQWRGSCCSHGVDVYAWYGGQLRLVEQASSYYLPVRKGARLMTCYIVPVYENGHVAWPDALRQTSDGLATGREPSADWCDAEVGTTALRLDILAEPEPGQAPRVLSTEYPDYHKTRTAHGPIYCLDVPVFDADARKVVRVTLGGGEVQSTYCQEAMP